jgi:metal-sulfur cluster biosynthetic enzyme
MDNFLVRKNIAQELRKVIDPELFVSIVDLGLIYNIYVNNSNVTIEMTLTTFGCPLFSIIEQDIIQRAKKVSEKRTLSVQLVFDPAWNMDMICPEARSELGIL